MPSTLSSVDTQFKKNFILLSKIAIAKKVLEVPKQETSKIEPKIAFELFVKIKANGIIEYESISWTKRCAQPRYLRLQINLDS